MAIGCNSFDLLFHHCRANSLPVWDHMNDLSKWSCFVFTKWMRIGFKVHYSPFQWFASNYFSLLYLQSLSTVHESVSFNIFHLRNHKFPLFIVVMFDAFTWKNYFPLKLPFCVDYTKKRQQKFKNVGVSQKVSLGVVYTGKRLEKIKFIDGNNCRFVLDAYLHFILLLQLKNIL